MIEAVQAIQTSIELVGKLRELSKKISDVDFKMLLADLSSELADAKLKAAELKSDLASLRQENSDLKQMLEQRDNNTPAYVDGVYRFNGEDGDFCTSCFDAEHRKIRLGKLTGAFEVFGKWQCPHCKATFG